MSSAGLPVVSPKAASYGARYRGRYEPWHGAWSRIRTSFPWMVGIAFGLRVLCIAVMHTYKVRTTEDNFGFGWEMGRIAASIASGHGFANPFQTRTGPTAWEPPLTPYLMAGVFKIFGIYSQASAFVLLTINSLWSALTCIPIFLVARRSFGETVAVGSAWTWALFPYVIYWDIKWMWETSLSALLITTIFWLAVSMEDSDDVKPWLRFGLVWGVAALNSPSLLSFLPASGLYGWYRRWRAGRRSLAGVLLASLIFLALVTPWLARNERVFGQPVFLRTNFGAELRMGNGPYADGTWQYYLHPVHDVAEFHRYAQMGELAYVRARRGEAVAWIKANPGRFAVISFRKFVYYWYGVPRDLRPAWLEPLKNSLFAASSLLTLFGLLLALRPRRPHAWLFFWLLLLYPLVYYVVFPHARYRHPVEPAIAILCVFVITQAETRAKPKPSDSAPQ
jgi:4-amino-4-deoxy-L-arabinose transferase-like glycosyltransferase